jgi:hypothetical protein
MKLLWRGLPSSPQGTQTGTGYTTTRKVLGNIMLLSLASLALLSWCIPLAAGQAITTQNTGFDGLPEKMFYFKDSDVSGCSDKKNMIMTCLLSPDLLGFALAGRK